MLAPGERVQATAFGTYMAVWNKPGQPRLRKCFPSLKDAKDWLESRREEGVAPPLTAAQYASAQLALAILPPDVTLADAARAFVASAGGPSRADATIRFGDAARRYLEDKRRALSKLTYASYSLTLRTFEAKTGNPLLLSLTPDKISKYATGVADGSRNRVIRTLSALFSWCVRHDLIYRNPCDRVERDKAPEPPRGVLTVEQTDALLHGAARLDPQLVPMLAIAAFAGIRPAEISRMDASVVGQEFIRLDARITKASRARTVTIQPNLRAWLDAYPPRGRLLYPGLRPRVLRLRRKLGIPWPHDCLRHSYATYAYEKFRDAAWVASEMGHRGTTVFFTHYRALANPGDGARFFDIRP